MSAGNARRSNGALLDYSLGRGRKVLAGGLIYLGLFAVVWATEGLEIATFGTLVLFALGLAGRIVVGLCWLLDDARRSKFSRRETGVVVIASVVLTATVYVTNLPMATITKGALVGGVIVYFVGRYAFRK